MTAPWRRREQIGDCTLYLGDCLEILPALGKVDAVVTDPPYEDELHAAVGKINRIRTDGFLGPESLGFDGINSRRGAVARAIVEASLGWALIFTLAEGVRAWRDELQACGAKWDTVLAWIKPDAAPRFNGQGAARGFENCISVWCGRGYRSWNARGKRGIYTHCVNGTSRHGAHPTEKPLSLMAELLSDFTRAGAIILDPFMGSGTTGVACVKLGRKFIGIEIDERYFDIACERIRKAVAEPRLPLPDPEPKQEALL